jgi:Ca2+-transporting ATPase
MMTMVPTLIAGSIAARSNPSKDPIDTDPSKSSAPLSNEEQEIHPDSLPRDDSTHNKSDSNGDKVV